MSQLQAIITTIIMIVLSAVNATAGIRHYCDYASDGHSTRYTYDAAGRKLRASYLRSNRVINTPVIGFQSIGDESEDAVETASFEFVTRPMPGIGDSIIEAKPFITLLTRDYCGSVIYRNDSIERILTSTGYITPDGVYHHYIRDYQGNVRIVATQDGEIIERNNYYPYGMLFPESETAQPFKYSGKEWDAMNGLNLYDFDARWHDPALCLFTTQDPKAEKYYPYSPYLYCAGNPIMLIDPTGMEIWINGTCYSIGMEYDGDDTFVKKVVSALNLIYNNGGDGVISDLVKSETKYNYTTTDEANSSTKKKDDGSVEMSINTTLLDRDAFISAVAHESMHGVQFENGQGGRSIFNEVEAYAFEYVVSQNTIIYEDYATNFRSNADSFNNNIAGKAYYDALFSFAYKQFTPITMVAAIITFKDGSAANNNGLYNSYPLIHGKINKFLLQNYSISTR